MEYQKLAPIGITYPLIYLALHEHSLTPLCFNHSFFGLPPIYISTNPLNVSVRYIIYVVTNEQPECRSGNTEQCVSRS